MPRAHAYAGFLIAVALATPRLAVAGPGCGCGWCDRPYGDYAGRHGRWGRYGAREPVKTADEARKRLEEFYAGGEVVVGPIVERDLHFEAPISEKDGTLLDKVIIDKRTGRIRSIL